MSSIRAPPGSRKYTETPLWITYSTPADLRKLSWGI
jgi:hypothetical protein